MAANVTKDMTEGSPVKLILGFFIPMLCGLLFQQLYNMADTIIVGKCLGVKALAAVGSTGSINFMIIGSIMPLIPGVAFTNAIRDIADGDYIAGAVRMLDAILVFLCIAVGVGVVITVYHRLTGGMLL